MKNTKNINKFLRDNLLIILFFLLTVLILTQFGAINKRLSQLANDVAKSASSLEQDDDDNNSEGEGGTEYKTVSTTSGYCSSEYLGFEVLLAKGWTCEKTQEYTDEVLSSENLSIYKDDIYMQMGIISSGPYCYSNSTAKCVITVFYNSDAVTLELFTLTDNKLDRGNIRGLINPEYANSFGFAIDITVQDGSVNSLEIKDQEDIIEMLDSLNKID